MGIIERQMQNYNIRTRAVSSVSCVSGVVLCAAVPQKERKLELSALRVGELGQSIANKIGVEHKADRGIHIVSPGSWRLLGNSEMQRRGCRSMPSLPITWCHVWRRWFDIYPTDAYLQAGIIINRQGSQVKELLGHKV